MRTQPEPFQTVIYNRMTGQILNIIPNRYIRHRSEILLHSPGSTLPSLGFFYEQAEVSVDILNDRIKQIARGVPPQVFSPVGLCKTFDVFLQKRRKGIMAAGSVLCLFEGGMGDQILQSEAVLQFKEVFKEKSLVLSVLPHFYEVVKNITGIYNVYPRNYRIPFSNFDLTVDNHTPYISDPRGGLFGKASLYGASLGLPRVHRTALLTIPPAFVRSASQKLGRELDDIPPIKIGFHIRSGSGHAKSWNTEPAQALALRFIKEHEATAFLIGAATDWNLEHPAAHRIHAGYQWIETAAVISRLNLLICIDSGPMHLARALGVPRLILWGGTSYRDILGREKQNHDFRLDLPCIDQLCYNCPAGTAKCMTDIRPEILYPLAIQLLKEATS